MTPSNESREAASTYNYESFDLGSELGELERWLAIGPGVGEEAPDFQVSDIEGKEVRLGHFRGQPVVLEFGSFTCPIFSDRVPAMESLAHEHPEAIFLVIYVREAHPGEIRGAHRSAADKRSAALRLIAAEGIQRRVLVDHLDGAINRAYGGAWNPVYVIGPDGRVAMRRAWNDPAAVFAALEGLRTGTAVSIPESVEMARLPGRRPMGSRLLERGGRQALLDFFETASDPIRNAFRTSADPKVRAVIAEHEAARSAKA